MLFRLLVEEFRMPAINTNKMANYCEKIRNTLWDDMKAIKIFNDAISIVEKALKNVDYDNREATRRKTFTTDLIETFSRIEKVHLRVES